MTRALASLSSLTLIVLVAGALGACEAELEMMEPQGVAAAHLCAAIVGVVCTADAACCETHPSDCVAVQLTACQRSIEPLLEDPRLAYDPVRGAALVASLQARGDTCWRDAIDYDAWLDVFAGTGAAGAECTPPAFDTASLRISALSCADDLACRLELDAGGRARGVCQARDDDACSHALDCGPERFCDLPAAWEPGLWGTCRPLRSAGWACTSDLECASRHCDGTCTAPPSSARCLATAYDDYVLEHEPTAYLRFDEATGLHAADAAGEHAGTLTETAMRDPATPIGSERVEAPMEVDAGMPLDAGVVADDGAVSPDAGTEIVPWTGGSVRFASDDAAVRVPPIAALEDAPGVSLECWVRTDGAEVTGPILELNDGAAAGVHLWAYDRGDELFANLVGADGVANVIETAEGTLTPNVWHHVAVTHDGTTARLYLDGRRIGELAVAGPLALRGDLYAGHRPSGETPVSFRGAIDEVAVYDRALEPALITRHYAAGLAGEHTTRFPLFRWVRP